MTREQVLHLFLEASRFAFADRNAPPQLHGPHHRPARRQPVLGRGLLRRLHDHHHRPADPRLPHRPRDDVPAAVAAPRASQRNTPATSAGPAFIASFEAAALRARGHAFTSVAEIGAATAIEILGDGRVLAAAEPVQRGIGSAAVERSGG